MDLFQLEESRWATLKAKQNACEMCVFSVESIKIMGSWYVTWWCLTHRYQHLGGNLAFTFSGLEGKNSCNLKRGGSRFLQIVWVYLPNLMESHSVTLFSTN